MVDARGLAKRFPNGQGLAALDVHVRRGRFVALVGPSGAGKTTFFRLVSGTLLPTAGAVTVLGQGMRGIAPGALRRLRSRIAVVPQAHGLVSGLSAVQNVAMGRAGRVGTAASVRTLLWPTRADRQAAFTALDRLGIGELLDQRVDQLSGGQQQRVAVARALHQDGELIMADEPVASVDAATAEIILGVFAELVGRGRTVLVSLHQPDLAARHCDEIVDLGARGSRR